MLILAAESSSSGLPAPGKASPSAIAALFFFARGKVVFVYGFSKSELGNIREHEEEQFKKMAKHVLALTDAQLRALIANGQFEEVAKND